MKLALSWLAEWVDWPAAWDAAELARRLTAAGFEVEALSTAAPPFERVSVARIAAVEAHPQADKLRVCRVETGSSSVQIVCGAANARVGLISALAQVGARMPGDVTIRAAKLRGVESQGMLCSASELGLSEASEGILELPPDAPVGEDLRRYLNLDDVVLDVNVTANRGDAMSVLGLAREVAALSGASLKMAPQAPRPAAAGAGADEDHFGVSVQPGSGAARLLVALLHGADNTRPTPLWMRERLRRVGLRSISAVVDVTNYVMLELGQPLHAYDRAQIHAGLDARRALAGERLTLLDGRDIELTPDVLLIADEQRPLGLAGVMGGQGSAISPATRDIVLEVAWFAPAVIVGRARRYGLVTDASQRFERGVDWRGQERALERAVALLAEITGAVPGAPRLAELPAELPAVPNVTLRAARLQRLLGVNVEAGEIERRLASLAMQVSRAPMPAAPASAASASSGASAVWHVQPPSWRFDIAIEADLIEEVARLRGLDAIADADAPLSVRPRAPLAGRIDEQAVMRTLAGRGYQEVITYAFVDPALQRTLLGEQAAIELANPIASDLSVMRASLWPGLVQAARENLRRQQSRVRLFELATQFERCEGPAVGPYRERRMLAGLALGSRLPEQWGSAASPLDFFDVKGDLQAVLALSVSREELGFEPASDVLCLHPGRSAHILRAGRRVGTVGELHPGLLRSLELSQAPLLFELDYEQAFAAQVAQFREVSRFPRIRRDISLSLPEQTAFATVRERVTVTAARLLKELLVFDVYHGDGVESGRKSLALGLILQDLDRTLTDEDADRTVRAVLDDLQAHLGARIREQRQP
jgi:phenylalanyl-tRNA synthetase beta chain